MVTNTYYFDASDGGPTDPNTVWTNDSNLFNGSTSTNATISTTGGTSSNFLQGDGTTSPTTGDPISQVRARVHGSGGGPGYNGIFAAVYTNGLGELLGTSTQPTGDIEWGSYVTLNVPSGGWTWQKVNDLEAKAYISFTIAGSANVAKIEIEVTSEASNSSIQGINQITGVQSITL